MQKLIATIIKTLFFILVAFASTATSSEVYNLKVEANLYKKSPNEIAESIKSSLYLIYGYVEGNNFYKGYFLPNENDGHVLIFKNEQLFMVVKAESSDNSWSSHNNSNGWFRSIDYKYAPYEKGLSEVHTKLLKRNLLQSNLTSIPYTEPPSVVDQITSFGQYNLLTVPLAIFASPAIAIESMFVSSFIKKWEESTLGVSKETITELLGNSDMKIISTKTPYEIWGYKSSSSSGVQFFLGIRNEKLEWFYYSNWQIYQYIHHEIKKR